VITVPGGGGPICGGGAIAPGGKAPGGGGIPKSGGGMFSIGGGTDIDIGIIVVTEEICWLQAKKWCIIFTFGA